MEEGGKGLVDIKIPIPSLQNKVSKKALNTPVSFVSLLQLDTGSLLMCQELGCLNFGLDYICNSALQYID